MQLCLYSSFCCCYYLQFVFHDLVGFGVEVSSQMRAVTSVREPGPNQHLLQTRPA